MIRHIQLVINQKLQNTMKKPLINAFHKPNSISVLCTSKVMEFQRIKKELLNYSNKPPKGAIPKLFSTSL